MDIPLVGKSFTWYRPNGKAKSKIVRIMVSREWLLHWQGSSRCVK